MSLVKGSIEYEAAVLEHDFIKNKIEKLDVFLRKVQRDEISLPPLDRELLEEQLHYMRGYARTLGIRLDRSWYYESKRKHYTKAN